MMVPLLCRTCHNTSSFFATVTVEIDLEEEAGEDYFQEDLQDLVTSGVVTCNTCRIDGRDNAASVRDLTAPHLSILNIGPSAGDKVHLDIQHTDNGYHSEPDRWATQGIYYRPGLRGVAERPDASNVHDSVVNWALTVIRELDIRLEELAGKNKSGFYIRLNYFQPDEVAAIVAKCREYEDARA